MPEKFLHKSLIQTVHYVNNFQSTFDNIAKIYKNGS